MDDLSVSLSIEVVSRDTRARRGEFLPVIRLNWVSFLGGRFFRLQVLRSLFLFAKSLWLPRLRGALTVFMIIPRRSFDLIWCTRIWDMKIYVKNISTKMHLWSHFSQAHQSRSPSWHGQRGKKINLQSFFSDWLEKHLQQSLVYVSLVLLN